MFRLASRNVLQKSPTEAELVGFTDNLGLVELFHEFVSFLLGHMAPIPIVFQDRTSAKRVLMQNESSFGTSTGKK